MAILAASAPTVMGINFLLWLIIGIIRFVSEMAGRLRQRYGAPLLKLPVAAIVPKEVAVIMAARNEEAAIGATIAALKKNVPVENIYIGSDASTDRTVAIARAAGCVVEDIQPNRGKARVLAHLIEKYKLTDRYRAVLVMDAEVIVSDTYLEKILPYFNDPEVAAFVSHAHSRWRHPWRLSLSMFYTAYRTRLWLILYYGLRYGQTWKYSCVTPIIPGGSSVYRSSALAQIEVDAPGFLIEDFNMTFQVYHKRLGRIASHPSAYVLDQEPYSLRDYVNQIERWYIGFWQTYIRHGYWPSLFWFATTAFTLEMVATSFFITALPFLLVLEIFYRPFTMFPSFDLLSLGFVQLPVTLTSAVLFLLAIDYVVTVITALLMRKPTMIVYGLGFFVLRYLDALVFLWSLPMVFMIQSSGIWASPVRRKAQAIS